MLTWKRKQIERKKKDTCLILYDAITLLTTLLVSEIKMAAKVLQLKVSDVLQGIRFSGKSHKITLRLGNCLIKVRIYCLLSLNLALFYKLCDFLKINCAIECDLRSILCQIAPLRNIRWPAKAFNLFLTEIGRSCHGQLTAVKKLYIH